MASFEGVVKRAGSMIEEERLNDLKKRLANTYGSFLINPPPDSSQSPLAPVRRDDPPAVKKAKHEANKKKVQAKQAYYKEQEPNAVKEIEAIMTRVRATLSDTRKVDNLFTEGIGAIHELRFVCDSCGNDNPDNILTDLTKGERICLGRDGQGCGQVMQENVMMQGMERRNFDETEDHAHYGPIPNRLMPDTVNLETKLNTYKYDKERGAWKERNSAWGKMVAASINVEMRLSTLNHTSESKQGTTQGYKTQQKKQAFKLMGEMASTVNIHPQVVKRAQAEFTKYREIRETIHQFEGVVMACLIIAFEDLSTIMNPYSSESESKLVADPFGVDGNNSSGRSTMTALEVVKAAMELDKENPIIGLYYQTPIGRFSAEQLNDWLHVVARSAAQQHTALTVDMEDEGYGGAVDTEDMVYVMTLEKNEKIFVEFADVLQTHLIQAQALQQQRQSISSANNASASLPVLSGFSKRKYDDIDTSLTANLFGTTTMKNRHLRYNTSTTSTSSSSSSASAAAAPSSISNSDSNDNQSNNKNSLRDSSSTSSTGTSSKPPSSSNNSNSSSSNNNNSSSSSSSGGSGASSGVILSMSRGRSSGGNNANTNSSSSISNSNAPSSSETASSLSTAIIHGGGAVSNNSVGMALLRCNISSKQIFEGLLQLQEEKKKNNEIDANTEPLSEWEYDLEIDTFITTLRSAIRERSQREAQRKEQLRQAGLETNRMNIDLMTYHANVGNSKVNTLLEQTKTEKVKTEKVEIKGSSSSSSSSSIEQPTQKRRVEITAVQTKKEEEEEEDELDGDLDLEDLIGGPVASSSKFDNMVAVRSSNNHPAKTSTSTGTKGSITSHANGSDSTGMMNSSAAAAAASGTGSNTSTVADQATPVKKAPKLKFVFK